jgi:hypothetical protein
MKNRYKMHKNTQDDMKMSNIGLIHENIPYKSHIVYNSDIKRCFIGLIYVVNLNQ